MNRVFLGVLVALSALVPVANVSATLVTYTDDFNRDDAATLGSSWSTDAEPSWTGGPRLASLSLRSGTAVDSDATDRANVYTAAATSGDSITASIDFQACKTGNAYTPNMTFGINYQGGQVFTGPEAVIYVQGTNGVKFFVDGDWRDTDSSVSLTAGTSYRLTVAKNGADYEGKLATLDGTTLKDFTYHSSLETDVTGNAFIRASNFPYPLAAGTPAFDNFSLTTTPVPEPGTLSLIVTGTLGLLCYAWRKRR